MRPALIAGLLLAFAATSVAQIQTNCSVIGNSVSCTSYDNGARIAEEQRGQYEAGRAIGRAIGMLVWQHRFPGWWRKYCAKHPGEAWIYANAEWGYSGTCPAKLQSGEQEPQSQQRQTTATQPSTALPDDLFWWFDEQIPQPGTKLFEVLVTPRAYDAVVELIRKARQGNTKVQAGTSVLDSGYRPPTVTIHEWLKAKPDTNPSFFYWADEKPEDTSAVMHFHMTERAYQQAIGIALNSGSLRFVPPPPTAQQPATAAH